MVDVVGDNPPEQVRGRPFAKGRSGNPAGRRLGSRNKATVAAQELLANEAEALTRKAVEAALAGDPMAMRLCLERILPRERVVKFALPPIKSAADVAPASHALRVASAACTATAPSAASSGPCSLETKAATSPASHSTPSSAPSKSTAEVAGRTSQ